MSEISFLAARLKSALEAIDWLGRPVFPTLRGPASREQLEAFEKKIGRKLPATYREFLRIHDGMDGLEQYDWGVAGTQPSKKGESFDDVRSGHQFVYKQQSAKHPALKDLKDAVIVGSDFDFQIVYFDRATWDEDEPQLRRLSSDQPYDEFPLFESFESFLEFVVTIYEDLVDMQNESFDMDEGESMARQDNLLKELAAILKEDETRRTTRTVVAAEPEPPAPKLSPEMELASRLCRRALDMLIDAELIEVIDGPGIMDALEELLLKKLLKSSNQRETISKWIDALSRAREVEELYGTDDQLASVMGKAFEEVTP